MSWQQALELVFGLLALVCALIVVIADWHGRNYRRIPRSDLICHRVTVRLPDDWDSIDKENIT